MITLAEFDSLEVGDMIETTAPFPTICPDKIDLLCTQAATGMLEFQASWRGISIGLWTARSIRTNVAGEGLVKWSMSH